MIGEQDHGRASLCTGWTNFNQRHGENNYSPVQVKVSIQNLTAPLWIGRVTLDLVAWSGLGSKFKNVAKGIQGSFTEYSSNKENIRKSIERIREVQDGFNNCQPHESKKIYRVEKTLFLNAVTKSLAELENLNSQ